MEVEVEVEEERVDAAPPPPNGRHNKFSQRHDASDADAEQHWAPDGHRRSRRR